MEYENLTRAITASLDTTEADSSNLHTPSATMTTCLKLVHEILLRDEDPASAGNLVAKYQTKLRTNMRTFDAKGGNLSSDIIAALAAKYVGMEACDALMQSVKEAGRLPPQQLVRRRSSGVTLINTALPPINDASWSTTDDGIAVAKTSKLTPKAAHLTASNTAYAGNFCANLFLWCIATMAIVNVDLPPPSLF